MALDNVNLEALTQAQAAWLLGRSARALRDEASLPRNADGTYNAAEVVKWVRGRTPQTDALSDADYELVLTITDWTCIEFDAWEAASRIMGQLRERCGDGALTAFADILVTRWNWQTQIEIDHRNDPQRHRRDEERERRKAIELEAKGELLIATVCDQCGRLRRGRQWVKAKPPETYFVSEFTCPACDR